ncbi:cell division protein FtsX [Hyphococcus sp.]|uniref:cell division protein FtsX n=1 Tax=Hyphococcus sp. TaxID=2038636 RepID=UPI003CCC003D
MTDNHTEDFHEDAEKEKPVRRLLRNRAAPLLPEAGAAGAPLTAVIAVMSFLAVLAMASLLMVNQAASAWTSALRSEITIQIKGADQAEIAAGVSAALRILQDTDGVIEAKERGKAETAALLEPWLGEGNADAFLNIPAIIEVKAAPELRNNLELLRNRLATAAPSASLDDHARWHNRLSSAARSGRAMALGVFLLVMGAACAISIFAARAGLAANHEIVSVLHLVGATDNFIAGEVQRRFFILGLRGALIGLAAALAALGFAGAAMRSGVARDSFLPEFSLGGWAILWLMVAPAATCLITALTARLTVLKTLSRQY